MRLGARASSFTASGQNGTHPRRGQSVLPRLARETGGQYLIPSSSLDAGAICEGIMNDLRTQYAVRYTPAVPRNDSSWRKLDVRVNIPGARVRTRSGYFASASKSSDSPP